MKGEAVGELQRKLRALCYPCGAVDGIYGAQFIEPLFCSSTTTP